MSMPIPYKYQSGTNPLCINLIDIGDPLCKNITRHLVTKLVSELGGLSTGPVD